MSREGRHKEALDCISEALRLDPGNADITYEKARILIRSRKRDLIATSSE